MGFSFSKSTARPAHRFCATSVRTNGIGARPAFPLRSDRLLRLPSRRAPRSFSGQPVPRAEIAFGTARPFSFLRHGSSSGRQSPMSRIARPRCWMRRRGYWIDQVAAERQRSEYRTSDRFITQHTPIQDRKPTHYELPLHALSIACSFAWARKSPGIRNPDAPCGKNLLFLRRSSATAIHPTGETLPRLQTSSRLHVVCLPEWMALPIS
jgi:hypothetical protein